MLWSVVELTAKVEGVHRDLAPGQSLRYIRCDLLERSGNQWGYKPLEESMHPYYYSCPLSYLDLAPEQSADWRAGVRAYHARRRTHGCHGTRRGAVGLSQEEPTWTRSWLHSLSLLKLVEGSLSNDEVSSDEEMLGYFIDNGLTEEQARRR